MLYNIWRKEPFNLDLKNEYRNYLKILDKVIKAAKIKYKNEVVKIKRKTPKHLWQYINSKLGKKLKNDANDIKYIEIDEKKIENPIEIANVFNSIFCKIGKNLSEKIKPPSNITLQLPPPSEISMFLFPIDSFEIMKIINGIKEKAGDVDGLNVKTLKTISARIAELLSYVFNLCMENSFWSSVLKNADVIPVYKLKYKGKITIGQFFKYQM